MFHHVGQMFERKFTFPKQQGILQELMQCISLFNNTNLAATPQSEKWKLLFLIGFYLKNILFIQFHLIKMQKTNSGEEFKHRADSDETIRLFSTTCPSSKTCITTAPTTRLQKHVGKHISYL